MALANPSHEKWYVLRVKPRSEKKVKNGLTLLGFEACVPTQMQLRKWSDRKKLVEIVLFQNYVFVSTDLKRRNEVFQVANVNSYLCFAGKTAELSEKEVVLIKKLTHLIDPVQITYESLQVNDEVEVLEGSLSGFRGKVVALNGTSRLQLALPTLNCFAHVELKETKVRKLSKGLSN